MKKRNLPAMLVFGRMRRAVWSGELIDNTLTENNVELEVNWEVNDQGRTRSINATGPKVAVKEDPAHRILSRQDPRGWTMPRWRPHASWLRHVESYL